MTEYGHHITHHNTSPLLSHDHVQEKKAARKKLLEEVGQRRVEIYRRFRKRMQEKALTL